eukprot:TRINITY_DN820_c0_g1_i1.p2 TRINITY_DN820_c0_g1~~TRINITY_DN820_c0_g1_i1.p2  ORF type:complete len:111 (+),score=36.97 TRINITY_DN820_c0_g1_i1:76-408(+)
MMYLYRFVHYICSYIIFFFLMIRRPPRSTQSRSSAASDVYKRQTIFFRIVIFDAVHGTTDKSFVTVGHFITNTHCAFATITVTVIIVKNTTAIERYIIKITLYILSVHRE